MRKPEAFAMLDDGSAVERVILAGGGLTMKLLSWGCVVQDLRLDGHTPPLVLGFPDFKAYMQHSAYFGATVGRFANRICEGRFAIDGVAFQAETNPPGRHMLHGGPNGIGRRNWRFCEVSHERAVLELLDKDGEMGFPGNCRLRATFALPGNGELAIRYEAGTDRPTLVNLAHHSYFNLAGSGDILDHGVQINADRYLPIDDEMIPTGEIAPVEASRFDFRKLRLIRLKNDGGQMIYDHNFCLASARGPLREVARAQANASGVGMSVATTEPGMQFYAGHKINTLVPGLSGEPYRPWAGFCLEPQTWPDSTNHPHFPQAVLRPGEAYVQETRYRFFWR